MQESVFVNRGFQLLKSFYFNHQVKCISQQSSESVAVFYHHGSENVVRVYPFKQKEHLLQYKYSVEGGFIGLIYSKKHQLFVASCSDLALRIFNERFELLDTVRVTTTVLSLAFNEVTSELYTGGVGCINNWKLRHQLHNPLVAGPPLQCLIEKDQWVTCLECNGGVSKKMMVVCQNCVIIVNTRTRKEVYRFSSTHRCSLTCAILVDRMDYLIIGAKDGSIKVWNCNLHYEVHTFTGHRKAVTGLKAHPNALCIVSCSLDGTIRTWHLENMTECYRVKCGEVVLGMCSDYPSGNKVSTYSHHEVKTWEVKELETHFTSVNSHMMNMFRVSCPDESEPPTKLRFDMSRPPAKLRFDVSGPPTKTCFDESGPPTKLRFDVPGPPAKLRFDVSGLPTRKTCTTELAPPARIVALAEDDGLRLLSPVSGQILTILFPMFSAQIVEDVVYLLGEEQMFVLLRMGVVLVVSTATNPCSTLQLWTPTSNDSIRCITTVTVVLKDGSKVSLIFGGQQSGDIILIHNRHSRLSMPNPCPSHFGSVIKLIGSCDPIDVTKGNHYALVSYGEDKIFNIWSIEVDKTAHIYLKVNQCVHLERIPGFTCLLGSSLCMAMDNKLVMVPLSELDDVRSLVPQLLLLSDLPLLTHEKYDDHTATIISLSCSVELRLFATSSRDGMVKIWNSTGQLVSELEFGDSLEAVCFSNPRGDLLVGFQKHICVIKAEDYLTSNYVSGVLCNEVEETPIAFDSELKFWYDIERVPTLPAEQELRDIKEFSAKPPIARNNKRRDASCLQSILDVSEESLESEVCISEHQLQMLVDVGLAQSVSQQYSMVLQRELRQSEISVGHQTSSSSHQSEALSAQSLTTPTLLWDSELPSPSSHSFTGQDPAPLVQVTPLESPSIKRPIAPDGFIPNSVIRAILRCEPPVVKRPSTYNPPVFKRRICLEDFIPTHAGYRRALLSARYSWESIECVPSFDTETGSRRDTRSVPLNMLRSRLKKQRRPEWSSNGSGATRSKSSKRKNRHAKRNGHEVDSNDSFSNKSWKAKKRKTKSAMARFSVSRESIQSKRKSKDAPEALDDNEAEVDEMELLIQKICGMSWFPKSALRRMKKARRTTRFGVDGNSLIVDQLFSELVSLLKTCTSLTFVEVCQALLDLNHAGALSAEQQRIFAFCLVDRNNNTGPLTIDTRRTTATPLYPNIRPNNDDVEETDSKEWTNGNKWTNSTKPYVNNTRQINDIGRINDIGWLSDIGRLNMNSTQRRASSTWPHINSTGSHINSVEWRTSTRQSNSTEWQTISSTGTSSTRRSSSTGQSNSTEWRTNSPNWRTNSTGHTMNSANGQTNSVEWWTNSTGHINSMEWRNNSSKRRINSTEQTNRSSKLGNTSSTMRGTSSTMRGTSSTMRGTSSTIMGTSSTMARTNSRMAGTNSTMAGTNSRMRETNSTMAGTNGTMAETNSTMRETNSTMAGTNSTMGGTNSTMGKTNSTMGKTNSTMAGTNSTMAGTNSTMGKTNSTMEKTNSIMAETNSTIGKTNSAMGKTNSTLTGTSSTLTGTSSTMAGQRVSFQTLKTLQELGVCTDEILCVILPKLTDASPELRETAFATLRSIASIDNKSQLYELLCDLGILRKLKMDEDEVMGELTERVKKGQVKRPSLIKPQAVKMTPHRPRSPLGTVTTSTLPTDYPQNQTVPHHTHPPHTHSYPRWDVIIREMTKRVRKGQIKPPSQSVVNAQVVRSQLSPQSSQHTMTTPSPHKQHHSLEHTLPPHTHSHPQDEVTGERVKNGKIQPPSLVDGQAAKTQLSPQSSQQTMAASSPPNQHRSLEYTLPHHTHSHTVTQDEVTGEMTETMRNGQVKPCLLIDAEAAKTQPSMLSSQQTVAASSPPKHHHPLDHTLPHHTLEYTLHHGSLEHTLPHHTLEHTLHHGPLEHTLPHHTHPHTQDEVTGEMTERVRNGQVEQPSLFDGQATKTQLSPLGTVATSSLPKHHHPLEHTLYHGPLEHTLPHHTHSNPQDEVTGELAERVRNGKIKPTLFFKTSKTQLSSLGTVAVPSSSEHHPSQEHTLPHHTHYPPTQLWYHTLPLDSTQYRVRLEQGSYQMTQPAQSYQPFLTAKTIATSTPHQDKLDEARANPSQIHPTGVQRVLMAHPHTLSQYPRAIELMMGLKVNWREDGSKVNQREDGSKVNRRKDGSKLNRRKDDSAFAYKWSEVYPVINESLSGGSVMEDACMSEYSCIANVVTERVQQRSKNNTHAQRGPASESKSLQEERRTEHCLVHKLACS